MEVKLQTFSTWALERSKDWVTCSGHIYHWEKSLWYQLDRRPGKP